MNDASVELDDLMRKPPFYNNWQLIFFGGMCSASICSVSFSGSFIDSLISFPLGCLLIIIQLFSARNELYSNIFECVYTPAVISRLSDAFVVQDLGRDPFQLHRRGARRHEPLLLLRGRLERGRTHPSRT